MRAKPIYRSMNIKYFVAFIFFFACSSLYVSAQSTKTDSLIAITKNGKPNEKVDALNKLSNEIMYDRPEEAKSYVLEAIKKAADANYKLGLGDAYNTLGVIYDISSKYDSSVYYYEKAIPIFNDIENLKGRGSAINNLGLIYWNMADYDKALHYFFDALKDFEKIKNERFQSNALNNIGMVYYDIHNYQQSLKYHLKAKAIFEKLQDPYLIGAVSTNIGNVYTNLKKLDSAEYYYLNAIKMHKTAQDNYGLSIAYNGYAGLLANKGDTARALDYFNQSLSLMEILNEKMGESSILVQMAEIYHKQKNPSLELQSLNRAVAIAEENNLKKDLIDIYKGLSQFYEKSNTGLALEYFKKYSTVKDSVFNEKSNHQITELNTKYETGKKELLLKQQDLQLTRKNFLIAGISGLLILISLLGYSYYKRTQLKQEKKLQEAVMLQQDMATKAVIVAEENERRRIAADLHDGVGQMMSVAKMNLSVFENDIPFKNEQQKLSFENVIGLIDESCREIRNVSHQMMPNALLKSGLASAIKEFIDKLDSRIIKVSLHTEGLNESINNNTETVLYRVIQECVNNVLKHSGADHLDISIIKDKDGIAATIEDNGKGFDSSARNNFEGIGLKNILSRINYLKGSVDFDSAPGKGTLVAIHVPVG